MRFARRIFHILLNFQKLRFASRIFLHFLHLQTCGFRAAFFLHDFYFSFTFFFHLAPVYIVFMHLSVFVFFFKFRGAFLNILVYVLKNCDLPVAFFAFFTLSKIVICQLHFLQVCYILEIRKVTLAFLPAFVSSKNVISKS